MSATNSRIDVYGGTETVILAQAIQNDTWNDISEACALAGVDFTAAATRLRPLLAGQPLPRILGCIRGQLAARDAGAVSCTIYLLARAHSSDLAAAAGWHALGLGCDDDAVIIALADVLQSQAHPRQTAPSLMQERASIHRSTTYLIKLADHHRTGGRTFLAEDMLREYISHGRRDLIERLAELYVEQREWRSARDVLRDLTREQATAYNLYLAGRCAVSLLLDAEIIAGQERLRALPEPGPCLATLLSCVWEWRVGDPVTAAQSCPDGEFPPLVARDAVALRQARSPLRDHPPLRAAWHGIGLPGELPNVLCIGMQRTATTWLWKQLKKHPDANRRTFKELVYFSDPFSSLAAHGADLRDSVLDEAGDRYWQGPTRSLLHYRSVFSAHEEFRIDVSPTYAELPEESVARLRQILGPDARIILSIRDPVERTWSNLKYDMQMIGEDPLMLPFKQRAAFYRSVATLRRCDYPAVFKTWRRHFHNLKILFTEDIAAKPAQVLAEIFAFIGFNIEIGHGHAEPVNATGPADMPRDDRLFLFGLHQQTYLQIEGLFEGPALQWRQRQLHLLAAP